MSPRNANTVLLIGGSLALILLIAAVWATSMAVPTRLALTGLLVLIAVAIFAVFAPRKPDVRLPVDEDAEQRERMSSRVP